MVTEKVKQLREANGFLADQDLYEFSEILVKKICADMSKCGVALTPAQQDVVKSFFDVPFNGR